MARPGRFRKTGVADTANIQFLETPMPRSVQLLLVAGLCISASTTGFAADTGPAPAVETKPSRTADRPADPLAAARVAIKAKQWPTAMDELRKLNSRDNADWNNLMGYALRKQATPDLDGAQRHYDAALRIDPSHQGALEYSGELALMKGDLATAEARQATLSKLCKSPCEALDDLNKSIARYKASGKG
jgi:Flp pilus assembly protein TadD